MSIINSFRNKLGKEVKAGVGYTIGNIVVNAIGFLAIPIFTKILLFSTADFGLISMYATYVNAFVIIIGLNLNTAVIRGYIDFNDKYDEFLSANIFLSLLSLLFFSIIIIIFRDLISSLSDFSYIIWAIIIIQSYCTFIINYNSAKCIVLYKYKQQILISFINTIIGTLLSILFVYLMKENRYLGKIAGGVIPMIFIAVFLLILILKKGRKLISKKYWLYSLKLSIPIMPHLLAHLILGQSDRLLIKRFVDDSAVGIYSLAYNIGLIVQIILMSINNAWLPWFFNKMAEKDDISIQKNSNIISMVIIYLSIGLMYISPELLRLVATEQYFGAAELIPIIILSYIFQFLYTLLVNVQFYHKKNYFVPIGTTIAATLNIVLNFIYIPLYGYQAAAYTTLVSYIVLFIVHFIVNKLILKSKVFDIKVFMIYIIVGIVATAIFILIFDLILIRYIIILAITLAMAYKFRDKISGFISNKQQ